MSEFVSLAAQKAIEALHILQLESAKMGRNEQKWAQNWAALPISSFPPQFFCSGRILV